MSNQDTRIIKILTEYIPRKKTVNVEETHSIRNQYICSNPDGPVDNLNCDELDPLCNCPAKELIPKDEKIVKLSGFWNAEGRNLIVNSSDIPTNSVDSFLIIRGLTGENYGKYEFVSKHDTYEEAKTTFAEFPYTIPSDSELDSLLKQSRPQWNVKLHLS